MDLPPGTAGGGSWRTLVRDIAFDLEKAFGEDDVVGSGDVDGEGEDNGDAGAIDERQARRQRREAVAPGDRGGMPEESDWKLQAGLLHRRHRREVDDARRKRRGKQRKRRSRQKGGKQPRRMRGATGGDLSDVAIRRVQWVSLRGAGYLRRLEFVTPAAARQDFFTAAGDWLVANQNASTGAWPVRARREIGRRKRRMVRIVYS